MNLLLSLRSEVLKTRWTASYYLIFAAAAFGPFMSMMDIIFDGIEPGSRNRLFSKLMINAFEVVGFLIFPFFILLICTLLPQIEFKNNTWKQVLASPQSKANVFFAKFLNIQWLILLFLLASQIMMLVAVVIVHFMEPDLNVLNQPMNWSELLRKVVNSYLSLQALCAIQFLLGLRFKNFIKPIGIGIGLWFAGSLMALEAKSPLAPYFPYSFHAYSFTQFGPKTYDYIGLSIAYAVIFLLLGFFDFKRRGKS
jgi:hypothetical protein